MSLLTPTKNLFSNIMANSAQPAPAVGMGATILMYTDRHAATIIEVINDKTIVIQQDNAKRIDNLGMTDSGQKYNYTANPDAPKMTYTLRSNGRWVCKGQGSKDGQSIMVGSREEFFDFCF